MKWSVSNISQFLQIYQTFRALWNIKEKNYSNKPLRDTLFKQLIAELEENQLLGEKKEKMEEKQLKSKIKSLKDVYRAELGKIEKSKKSGSGTDDIYEPKLSWFNEANYFSEVMAVRSSTSNFDLQQSNTSEQDEEGENTTDPDDPGIGDKATEKTNTAHSSRSTTPKASESTYSMKPPEPPKKRYKKCVDNSDKEISQAINKLDSIANKAAVEKPYDVFGKYVAAELRQPPNRAAILLQQDIQNCITRSKLNILDEAVHEELNNYSTFNSPHSITSISGSSNHDEDILQTAMINTFSPI